jgi:hypothetical protein
MIFRGPSDMRGWGLFDAIQRSLDGKLPPQRREATRDHFQDWLDQARPAHRLILSDENLSGSMLQNHRAARLYPDADQRLRAFASLFPVQPDVIHVTLRDFVGYWQSVAAHLAQLGKLSHLDPQPLLQGTGASWLPFLQSIRRTFPTSNLRVMHYDDTVVSRLLCAMVGEEVAAMLPAPLTSFGLALDDPAKSRLEAMPPGPARDALAQTLRRDRDPPERLFQPKEAAALHAAYAADWQALRAGSVPGVWLDQTMDPQA